MALYHTRLRHGRPHKLPRFRDCELPIPAGFNYSGVFSGLRSTAAPIQVGRSGRSGMIRALPECPDIWAHSMVLAGCLRRRRHVRRGSSVRPGSGPGGPGQRARRDPSRQTAVRGARDRRRRGLRGLLRLPAPGAVRPGNRTAADRAIPEARAWVKDQTAKILAGTWLAVSSRVRHAGSSRTDWKSPAAPDGPGRRRSRAQAPRTARHRRHRLPPLIQDRLRLEWLPGRRGEVNGTLSSHKHRL